MFGLLKCRGVGGGWGGHGSTEKSFPDLCDISYASTFYSVTMIDFSMGGLAKKLSSWERWKPVALTSFPRARQSLHWEGQAKPQLPVTPYQPLATL